MINCFNFYIIFWFVGSKSCLNHLKTKKSEPEDTDDEIQELLRSAQSRRSAESEANGFEQSVEPQESPSVWFRFERKSCGLFLWQFALCGLVCVCVFFLGGL